MKRYLKNNYLVLIAILLPILFIIIVTLTAYLPSIFLKTNYDFIYAICEDNTNNYPRSCKKYLNNKYSIINTKIVLNNDPKTKESSNYESRLFIHDTENNESKEISYTEALDYSYSNLLTSPDGVTVSSGYQDRADFFIFSSSNSGYEHNLIKGNVKKKLNLINNSNRYNYENNFIFIGWIISDVQ